MDNSAFNKHYFLNEKRLEIMVLHMYEVTAFGHFAGTVRKSRDLARTKLKVGGVES